jgi:hypothetical protein
MVQMALARCSFLSWHNAKQKLFGTLNVAVDFQGKIRTATPCKQMRQNQSFL